MVGLDIRWAIGLLFVTFGLLLAGFGATSDASLYERSLGVNVNLWWGVVMLAFGAVMLALAVRGRQEADREQPRLGGPPARLTLEPGTLPRGGDLPLQWRGRRTAGSALMRSPPREVPARGALRRLSRRAKGRHRGVQAHRPFTRHQTRDRSPHVRARHDGRRRPRVLRRRHLTVRRDGARRGGRADRRPARGDRQDAARLDRAAVDRRREPELPAGTRVHGAPGARGGIPEGRDRPHRRQGRRLRHARRGGTDHARDLLHVRREAVRSRRVEFAAARGADRRQARRRQGHRRARRDEHEGTTGRAARGAPRVQGRGTSCP